MWHARPVFISSTFADMQAERDHLRTRVFPALEERLRARRHHLEWVDLRVGVATAGHADEGVRELQVLKVCLAEVRRCRPFLIVLLGDRYGWVPPPERISTAAAEEGFSGEIAGRSVTELEIDFGVLADPAQQQRSIFYFREALPYGAMEGATAALFSDAHAGDPAAAERARRLGELKQRIGEALPGRVRRYTAQWNAERQRVEGLEDFGRMVLDDIWAELDAETAAADAVLDIPWEEEERNALDDFSEDRARDFVGRDAILAQLETWTLSPAEAGAQEGASWGLCLTGEAGSGKSALFAELYRRLGRTDAFVLAHAAGASVRAASVDLMLRRWIGALAAALGTDPGLPEEAGSEEVEAAFAALLAQMARERRVVLLIDALDQFETTLRGRHATFLPRVWPDNVRLLATAIPGEATTALSERDGCALAPLPPLDADEARGIIAAICARYHRTFEPEVPQALIARAGAAGPAWGNPLWLVLAVEELNLLDADDFLRAQKSYTGAPAERLRAMMLDEVENFPTDIPGLYRVGFSRAEDIFSASFVRTFLGLVAVSRGGWRESDFRLLLPALTGEPFDDLRFASLRRLFRGQMRQRGALGQWDFNHAQMRLAVRSHLAGHGVDERTIHAAIADRLLALPADDPLRISETMVHLIGGDDWTRAANFFGDASLSDPEVKGAAAVLADQVLRAPAGEQAEAAHGLARLLEAPGLPDDVRGQAAERFFKLGDAVGRQGPSDIYLIIYEHMRAAFDRLAAAQPDEERWPQDISICLEVIGGVLRSQGRLEDAQACYEAGLAIMERLAAAEGPDAIVWYSGVALARVNIGRMLMERGELEAALESFLAGKRVTEFLAETFPALSHLQSGLADVQNAIADVHVARGQYDDALAGYRASLAIFERLLASEPGDSHALAAAQAHAHIGGVLGVQGRYDDALVHHRASHAITERLAAADPADTHRQSMLASCRSSIGELLRVQSRPGEAMQYLRASLAIWERLAAADPANLDKQGAIAGCRGKIADALIQQEDFAEAIAELRTAHAIVERLAVADPSNASWQRELASSKIRLGTAREKLGFVEDALAFYRAGLAIVERLNLSDPANVRWQEGLAFDLKRVGAAVELQDKLARPLADYRASLAGAGSADGASAQGEADTAAEHEHVGDLLLVEGKYDDAVAAFAAALLARRKLADGDPQIGGEQRPHFARLHKKLGDALYDLGRADIALTNYRASLASTEILAADDPGDPDLQRTLAILHERIGDLRQADGALDEARAAFDAAIPIRAGFAADDSGNLLNWYDFALLLQRVSTVAVLQERTDDALDTLGRGFRITQMLTAETDNAGVAQMHDWFGRYLAMMGGEATPPAEDEPTGEASNTTDEAVAAFRILAEISPETFPDREGEARRALAALESREGPGSMALAIALQDYARLLWSVRRLDDAVAAADGSFRILDGALGADSPSVQEAWELRCTIAAMRDG